MISNYQFCHTAVICVYHKTPSPPTCPQLSIPSAAPLPARRRRCTRRPVAGRHALPARHPTRPLRRPPAAGRLAAHPPLPGDRRPPAHHPAGVHRSRAARTANGPRRRSAVRAARRPARPHAVRARAPVRSAHGPGRTARRPAASAAARHERRGRRHAGDGRWRRRQFAVRQPRADARRRRAVAARLVPPTGAVAAQSGGHGIYDISFLIYIFFFNSATSIFDVQMISRTGRNIDKLNQIVFFSVSESIFIRKKL